jgi:hypothetical protein
MTAFLSGISVFCFVASYAVALACEASRLVFRSGVRGAVMVAFAAAGLLAHTLFLGWRAVNAAAMPLSSPFDWYLLAAWLLAAGYLYLTVINPRTPVGLFMLPVVLALGAIAGLMWLIQAGRLARKQAPLAGFRMPSLERLAAVTARTPSIAAWTAAAGFVSGIVLNAVNRQRGLMETVPWTDPVVLRMGALVAWLVVADALAAAARRRPDGPRTGARLAIVSLGVLTLSIVWGLLAPTKHGQPPVAPATREAAP